MLYLGVCLFWVAKALAAPTSTDVVPLEHQQPTVIPIVSQSEELEPNGTYKFSYETGNGIKREEISYDKVVAKAEGRSADSNEGGESDESGDIHVQIGSYSYTAPDGTLISVRYIADENGFQPIGDHIPSIGHPSVGNFARGSKSLKKPDSAPSESAPELFSAKVESPEVPPEVKSEAPKHYAEISGRDVSAEASTLGTVGSEAPTEEPKTEASAVLEAKSGVLKTEASPETLTPEVATAAAKDESSSASTTEALNAAESSTGDASTEAAATEGLTTAAAASEASSESSTTEAQLTTIAVPNAPAAA